jgi:hypothetical protein
MTIGVKWPGRHQLIDRMTTEPHGEVRGLGVMPLPYKRWLDLEIVERGPLEELMWLVGDGVLRNYAAIAKV